MDWTALFENAPALFVLIAFVVATLAGFLYTAFRVFNRMIGILSEFLENSLEANRKQGDKFVESLDKIVDSLKEVKEVLIHIRHQNDVQSGLLIDIQRTVNEIKAWQNNQGNGKSRDGVFR